MFKIKCKTQEILICRLSKVLSLDFYIILSLSFLIVPALLSKATYDWGQVDRYKKAAHRVLEQSHRFPHKCMVQTHR